VATGSLPPAQIASPLRSLFNRRRDVKVLQSTAIRIDAEQKILHCSDIDLSFDYLVVAAGSKQSYFGHDSWANDATGLKTLENAMSIRDQIFSAFEHAELENDPDLRRAYLTFTIIGGGPTGVELAGAIAEVAKQVVVHDFKSIDTRSVSIILLEASDRILRTFSPRISSQAAEKLRKLGVEIRTNRVVTDVSTNSVAARCGDTTELTETHTIIWSAGVQASPLANKVADAYNLVLDRSGRVPVNEYLSVNANTEVFVVGDMSLALDANNVPLPCLAPVALSQGAHVAKVIAAREEQRPLPPFHYTKQPSFAVIGRNYAIVEYLNREFTGPLVWLAWCIVHILFLIEFRNRFMVMLSWLWSYLTFQIPDRLILTEKGDRQEEPTVRQKG